MTSKREAEDPDAKEAWRKAKREQEERRSGGADMAKRFDSRASLIS